MKRWWRGLVSLVVLVVWGALWPAAVRAASPWTPARGTVSITPVFVYESFDRFWMGTHEVDGPDHGVHQVTFLTTIEYGLRDDLTLDLTTGYTRATFESAVGDQREDGLADTSFGFRYRLIDEFRTDLTLVPTLTLRLGGIVEGTYQEGLVQSPGDGASGLQVDALFGHAIGATGLGVAGGVGYRHRLGIVPDEFLGSIGLYQTLFQYGLVSVGFRHDRSLAGEDIGDRGFNFPGLKEVSSAVEAGLGLSHPDGHYLGFSFAGTVDGRNTGKKLVYGAVLTLSF